MMMVEASKCKSEIYREPFNATVDIAYTSKVIALSSSQPWKTEGKRNNCGVERIDNCPELFSFHHCQKMLSWEEPVSQQHRLFIHSFFHSLRNVSHICQTHHIYVIFSVFLGLFYSLQNSEMLCCVSFKSKLFQPIEFQKYIQQIGVDKVEPDS